MQPLTINAAWKGDELLNSKFWNLELNQDELKEIEEGIKKNQLLKDNTLELSNLKKKIQDIAEELENGTGTVLLKGFPVDKYSEEEIGYAYLKFCSHLGTPVRQPIATNQSLTAGHDELVGYIKAEVKDEIQKAGDTNQSFKFHTDRTDVISLLCIRQAREGGETKLVSAVSIYNEMLQSYPELVDLLFEDYPRISRSEKSSLYFYPIWYIYKGKFTTQFISKNIKLAQLIPGVKQLTAHQEEALSLIQEIAEKLCTYVKMNPGDLLFMNNHVIYHARASWKMEQGEYDRLLMRIWLSPFNNRELPDTPAFRAFWGNVEAGVTRGFTLRTLRIMHCVLDIVMSPTYLEIQKLREIEKSIFALKQSQGEEPICAYLYDLSYLKDHVTRVVSTLTPQCKMYYALKANSARAILETLAPIVDGFEVASAGEIEKIKAVEPSKPFLFGVPGKTNAQLKEAVRQGVEFINVESLYEIMRLERIAQQLGKVVPILLRVNLRESLPSGKLQMAGVATQFGIDEVEVGEVIERTRTSLFLKIEGFHFHSMSNNLDSDAHIEFISLCIKKSLNWSLQYHLPLSCINVGGGIGINYLEIDEQFAWDHFTDRLWKVLSNNKNLPPIYFECGRYLVAACGYYAVEVLDIKKNHGPMVCHSSRGTHHFRLPAAYKHSHPFSVLHLEEESMFSPRVELREAFVTVVGELCTPSDVLARNVLVESIQIGDVLVFKYVGAYGWEISHHNFLSHPHPRQILL